MSIREITTQGYGSFGSIGAISRLGFSSGVAPTGTTMFYGSYQFKPVPFVILRKELLKSNDLSPNIGATFRLTLKGTLTPFPGDTIGGLNEIVGLQQELREALNQDGRHFVINCGQTELLATCPRILSVEFDESGNNWVMTCPYTIEIEFDQDNLGEDPACPPFIESFDESWQVEMEQENRHFDIDLSAVSHQVSGNYYGDDQNAVFVVRVTHTVSVTGKRSFNCVGAVDNTPGQMTTATENALAWINGGYFLPAKSTDSYHPQYAHALSGVLNMSDTDFTATDHFRSTSINKHDGTVSLTENWVVVGDTGINRYAIEDYEVTVKNGVDPLNGVTINGSIKGYVNQLYGNPSGTSGYSVETTAWENATSYWNVIKARIFPRAQLAFQNDVGPWLNPFPVVKSIGSNPSKGVITYSAEYDSRPCLMISGALQEEISITNGYPTDVYAEIQVLGRMSGPILQAMSTVTASTREMNIDVTVPLPTGCNNLAALDAYYPGSQVNALLCDYQTSLEGSFDQVFLTESTETWSPRTGRFSHRAAWKLTNCGGSSLTSFC